MKVVRSSPLRTGRLHPQEFPWYSFLEAESTPGHMVPSVTSEKIPSDTTGDRSRDLPTSSAVPQPLRHPRPWTGPWGSRRLRLQNSSGLLRGVKWFETDVSRLPIFKGQLDSVQPRPNSGISQQSFSLRRPNQLCYPSSLWHTGYLRLFRLRQNGQGVKVTANLHLVRSLRMSVTMPLPSQGKLHTLYLFLLKENTRPRYILLRLRCYQ
jgi:hypothetical protein